MQIVKRYRMKLCQVYLILFEMLRQKKSGENRILLFVMNGLLFEFSFNINKTTFKVIAYYFSFIVFLKIQLNFT